MDPDGDSLTFGVRQQPGSDVIRIENVNAYEANVYVNKMLDREVMKKFYTIWTKSFFSIFFTSR